MESNKNSGRTNIIDDFNAIALAQQGQHRAPKKSKIAATVPSITAKASSSEPGPSKHPGEKQDGGDPAESSRSKPVNIADKQMVVKNVYQKDGLKIPLYDRGNRPRQHARLAKTLRNKGTDILLAMVEEIGGPEKRKEFKKAGLTKLEMAEWIEMVETRALGPHPNSLHNWIKDDFVIQTEDYPVFVSEPSPEPETVADQVEGQDAAHTAAQDLGKRKRDNASEPARNDQQTTKRFRPHDKQGRLVEQLLTENNIHKVDASTRNERPKVQVDIATFQTTRATPKKAQNMPTSKNDMKVDNPTIIVTKPTPEKPKKLPTIREDMDEETPDQHTEQQKELGDQARLERYMVRAGLHSDDKSASSKIVILHHYDEVRVLTASTVRATGRLILHNTAGPIDIPGAQARLAQLQASKPAERPFLKKGQHGRQGDFTNDRDLWTGRGHQLSRRDQTDLDEYYQFRGKVLAQYPRYPAVEKGQVIHEEIKKAWDEGERWYRGFTRRFPGFAVNHLWPCGCEKLRGECEDSESEAE